MLGPTSPALVLVPSLTFTPLPSSTDEDGIPESSMKTFTLVRVGVEKWNFSSLAPGLQFSQYQISSNTLLPHAAAAPGTCLYMLLPPGALSVTLATLTPGDIGPGIAMRTLPLPVGW